MNFNSRTEIEKNGFVGFKTVKELWDNRKDSPTYGQYEKLIVGQSNKVSVLIPPGVVHGYKSISEIRCTKHIR